MVLLRAACCVLRQFSPVRLRLAVLLTFASLSTNACSRSQPTFASPVEPLPPITLLADSARTTVVAPGVKHRYYWMSEGPWAINVLEVDRAACWTPVAVKGRAQAVGREKTSVLITAFADTSTRRGTMVAGGVNADFFTFSPAGVPVGGLVHRGRVLTGPAGRPMLAVNRDGNVYLANTEFTIRATAKLGTRTLTWNHVQPTSVALLDESFGERTDTATGAVEVSLRIVGGRRHLPFGIVTAIDTAPAGVPIPARGFLLSAGARADSAGRQFVAQLRIGDTVRITPSENGGELVEAVGGFPMLVRNDSVLGDVHTAGSGGFRSRNPRTAVGLGASGRRLLLVTVDGRQPPYSDGMTLEELASIMRRLGATEVMNLDGGGSTTFVVRDSTGAFRIANHPSDREGERPVADAIAIEHACGTHRR